MSSVVVSMLSPANGAANASQLPNKINNSCFPATGADGKPVEPQVEVKATRFGLDVTEILKRHGIPLTMLPGSDTWWSTAIIRSSFSNVAASPLERHKSCLFYLVAPSR